MGLIELKNNKQIQKVIEILEIGGRSKKTISNYSYAICRFLNYFQNKDIANINEDDIIQYMKSNYLNKSCSANTYNMNVCAIKYFYAINFNKDFNNKLLPHAKLTKKLALTLDKTLFIKIFDEEKNLKHKCWLLLAYTSGLRVHEIAKVKISDINANEHKLKVLGKRNKERYTVLTDFTLYYLRLYFKNQYYKNDYFKYMYLKSNKPGYLFEGNQGAEYINSGSITNYFYTIKEKYNLDKNLSFHSLRHSFATNFIKDGGDPFVLKSMLGHSSLNTTNVYVHTGRDFNTLKGVNYDKI